MTSTPLAASTSSALANAGSDSACVSMPRKSGPSMPCLRRYWQIAWRDREDVRFVERCVERRAAVAGGAERDALRRLGGIGPLGVIGGDELRDVDELFG